MEDEVVVQPQETPEVPAGNEPQAPSEENTQGNPPPAAPAEDERTSAFKELRAHNKELARALKEQSLQLQQLSQRIPVPEAPSLEKMVKPTLSMFSGDVEAYESALEHYADAKHRIQAQTAQQEQWRKQQESETRDHTIHVEFEQKLNLARQTLPDLDGTLARIQADNVGANIHDQVVAGIKASPVAAELFHFLEANRAETARIEQMKPQEQIAALRAIEGWVMRGGYRPVAAPAAAPSLGEPVPEAPPSRLPPRPTGGSGVTHTPSLAKAQSPREYLAAFRAEQARLSQ